MIYKKRAIVIKQKHSTKIKRYLMCLLHLFFGWVCQRATVWPNYRKSRAIGVSRSWKKIDWFERVFCLHWSANNQKTLRVTRFCTRIQDYSMPKMSNETRSEGIGMLRAGVSIPSKANRFCVSKPAAYMPRDEYTLTNMVKYRPMFDKSPVTERAQDVHLRIARFHNRVQSFIKHSRKYAG